MDSIATDTPHYHDFTPPFAIPSSWQWVRLGKISNYGECLNIPVDNISSEEWILELEDLEKGTATIIQVLSKKDRNIKGVRHKFDKGNVLYSKLRTYLNKVLVAPCDGYCTTEIIPFNSYGGISTDYLTYVLRSAYFVNYTQQCGYGVKMPRLSTSDACKGLIPLPPIAEQERIVMQIKLWSNLIDQMDCNKNNLQNEIVQVKYKILELAVTGKLVPQNPDDEPAAELLKRINPDAEIVTDNGHYPQLPANWLYVRLGDVVKVVNGKSQKDVENQSGEYPIYGSGGIIGYADSFSCVSGSTIIGRKGTINNPIFVETDFWNVDTVFGMKPYDGIIDRYFYVFCQSFDFTLLDKSSTLPSLTKSAIENIPFPLPPLEMQRRILSEIDRFNHLFSLIQEAI